MQIGRPEPGASPSPTIVIYRPTEVGDHRHGPRAPDRFPAMSANRLSGSPSAYLQSAAHQPIHWYPWSAEAF
jgi:hypothetical protein